MDFRCCCCVVRAPHILNSCIQPEEIYQSLIILKSMNIHLILSLTCIRAGLAGQRKTHKHRPARIGRIRDENILFRAAVELINQPRINRTESKNSFLVRSFDFGLVFQKPQKLANRRVGGQG